MNNEELLQKIRMCGHYLHRMPDGRMSQRRILGILNEREKITQRELQGLLDVRSASMSEILGKIESEGLIRREPSPEDRRNMLVELSEEGRTVATALRQAYDRQTDELFSCLDEDEKERLGGYLDRLQAHWQEKFAAHGEDEPRGPRPFGPGPHRPGPGGPRGPRPHLPHDDAFMDPPMERGPRHGEGRGDEGHGPHGRPGRGEPENRAFDERREGGFGGAPRGRHGRPERPEQTMPGRFDEPGRPGYRVLPGEGRQRPGDKDDALSPLPGGEDVCIHDCAHCALREQGRCVRRVQRRT